MPLISVYGPQVEWSVLLAPTWLFLNDAAAGSTHTSKIYVPVSKPSHWKGNSGVASTNSTHRDSWHALSQATTTWILTKRKQGVIWRKANTEQQKKAMLKYLIVYWPWSSQITTHNSGLLKLQGQINSWWTLSAGNHPFLWREIQKWR